MTERERFSAYILEKYNSDVVWYEGNPIKAMDLMLWQSWQAATKREGFKFVPVCTHEWSIQLSGRFVCDLCGEDMIGAVDD